MGDFLFCTRFDFFDDVNYYYYGRTGTSSNLDEEKPLRTPLMKAILLDDEESAEEFIKKGEHISGAALHAAIERQKSNIINLLLEAQVDVNYKDSDNYTPLTKSIKRGCNNEIIMKLIERGCDIHDFGYARFTPLHFTIEYRNLFIAEQLLKKGVDVNCIDYSYRTPLYLAVFNNDIEAVCMLLYYDADVNISHCNGLTPFMLACDERKTLEIGKILIDYCDDFEETDMHGCTPLLLALKCESPLAIELIKRGADVDCIDSVRNHGLDHCLQYKDPAVFKLIWQKMNLRKFSSLFPYFLTKFISECKFSNAEWLECFYKILNCSLLPKLCKDDSISFLFHYLFLVFSKRNISLSDRLGITAHLLSYGTEITMGEIDEVYETYGFNEDFELLLNCAFINNTKLYFNLHWTYSLASFTLGQDKKDADHFILDFIECIEYKLMRFQYKLKDPHEFESAFARRDPLKPFSCFWISHDTRQTIINNSIPREEKIRSAIAARLESLSEVPSLTELARNQVRANVKKCCMGKEPHYYLRSIRMLPIPKKLKDILLFKDSIY